MGRSEDTGPATGKRGAAECWPYGSPRFGAGRPLVKPPPARRAPSGLPHSNSAASPPGPQRTGKRLPPAGRALRFAGAGASLRGLLCRWSSCTLVCVTGADPVDRLVPLNQRTGSGLTRRQRAGSLGGWQFHQESSLPKDWGRTEPEVEKGDWPPGRVVCMNARFTDRNVLPCLPRKGLRQNYGNSEPHLWTKWQIVQELVSYILAQNKFGSSRLDFRYINNKSIAQAQVFIPLQNHAIGAALWLVWIASFDPTRRVAFRVYKGITFMARIWGSLKRLYCAFKILKCDRVLRKRRNGNARNQQSYNTQYLSWVSHRTLLFPDQLERTSRLVRDR